MAFSCQICFEKKSVRLALPRLATGNGDVLRVDDCQHPVCQECLSIFVSTRIEEQRVFNIRCPFVGCTCEIFEQDVQRLVQVGALALADSQQFSELRSRDFSARAQLLSGALLEGSPGEDFESIRRIWQTMRFCPRCNLAIERSQGCNSFYCICGNHFDFATAPRVVGNGVENFSKVIEVAKTLGVPLTLAESFGKDNAGLGKAWSSGRAIALHRNVSRIAAESGTEFEDAWKLQQQARNGDEEARAKIRAAKHRTSRTENRNGEQEHDDKELYELAWDSLLVDEVMEKDDFDICAVDREPLVEEQVNKSQDVDGYMQGSVVPEDLACKKITKRLAPVVLLCPEVVVEKCAANMTETETCDYTK